MLTVLTHLAYWSVIALLAMSVPAGFIGDDLHEVGNTLFVVGFLGAWRYTWAAINFTRAIIYRRVVWPTRKALHRRRFAASGVRSHMYVMITTYGMPPETTLMVYRRLMTAAANARDGATIVASVVDGQDERLIRNIYENSREDLSHVRLIIDRIKSAGKRDAIAQSLRILAKFAPTENDIVVFADGDTAVPENIWEASAPCFSDLRVGALTTDEAAKIDRDNLYRDWFDLRFNQRQVMMCSNGLSKRVLTLTGRMSVFRATLATDPEFIEGVDNDFLDHWRLGRVTFLTGDDKSTWFWLLKNGYQMLYLPDVQSESVEEQPRDTFLESAQTLMVRWFGNMLRTNSRALDLSPRRIGYFTWWAILDQKLSMWTTLVGPISVILAAIIVSPAVIPLYVAWVMATRYLFCIYIFLFRGTWFKVTHPPLLYFGQIVGAAIKTFVFFRLDRQRWTRQGSGGSEPLTRSEKFKRLDSLAHHAMAVTWLTLAIALLNTIE